MSLGETGGILLAAIGGRPVGIMGTGMKIPEKMITNADLEKMVDTSNDWIVERTGINTRHIVSDGDSNAGLSAAAAMNAMKDAGIAPDHIDMVIVGTNSPDTLFPGVGPVVQDIRDWCADTNRGSPLWRWRAALPCRQRPNARRRVAGRYAVGS